MLEVLYSEFGYVSFRVIVRFKRNPNLVFRACVLRRRGLGLTSLAASQWETTNIQPTTNRLCQVAWALQTGPVWWRLLVE